MRRRALLTVPLALILLAGVAIVGERVRRSSWPLGVDGRSLALLSRAVVPWWAFEAAHLPHVDVRPATVLVQLGSPAALAVAVAALGLWAALRRDWATVALTLVSSLLASLATEALLKPLVDRRLGGALTYPSGHATGAATISALLVFVSLRLVGTRALRWVALPALALPVVVGTMVVHLGWHYPTDAVAGVAVGWAVVMLGDAALSLVSAWHARHRTTPPLSV
jgi:membrane-associated phospholipid phosphatase